MGVFKRGAKRLWNSRLATRLKPKKIKLWDAHKSLGQDLVDIEKNRSLVDHFSEYTQTHADINGWRAFFIGDVNMRWIMAANRRHILEIAKLEKWPAKRITALEEELRKALQDRNDSGRLRKILTELNEPVEQGSPPREWFDLAEEGLFICNRFPKLTTIWAEREGQYREHIVYQLPLKALKELLGKRRNETA